MPPRPVKSWTSTLRLPKSKFPYRASPADQAKYLQRCTDDLYTSQQNDAARDTRFLINDGPPYANGHLHVGHALNKILKDFINRVNLQQGKRIEYTPGWDCHGLPIEMKALEKERSKNADGKLDLDVMGVRRVARALASKTVKEQMKLFRRMGVMGDWAHHWKTMDKNFEIKQLNVFLEMVKQGLIFRRFKPVYWSPSTVTALAEGELEYVDDYVSKAAMIKFPITNLSEALRSKADLDLSKLNAVIWTTTPWTLPANKAIAIHNDLEYCVVELDGEHLIVAKCLLPKVLPGDHVETKVVLDSIPGADLVDSTYCNPLSGDRLLPVIHAGFVSGESGSGLVHIAPGHGMEDYEVCVERGIKAFAPVDDAGCYTNEAYPAQPDLLAGLPVMTEGTPKVLEILGKKVLRRHDYKHRYPHDWRTKLPVIVRATEQWFADVGSIKDAAIKNLSTVKFIPDTGRTRLESFINGRSEWCISRQRSWGVPIPALYDEAGKAALTEETVSHIIRTIEQRGIDAWWTDAPDDPAWIHESLTGVYRRGKDTMDVWFDSGTSWTQTTEPADVYLEGSDQHRGWFQSSLLTHTSASGRGTSPFKTLITHGFTLDESGRKMSKSIGNILTPEQIMDGSLVPPIANKGQPPKPDALGADALRLWVASSVYTHDVVIGASFLKYIHTIFVKYRTIIKMLLGSIHEHQMDTDRYPLTSLDYIALAQLDEVTKQVSSAYGSYEFHKGISALNEYVSTSLSAFYVDVIKDRLYCGDGGSVLPVILIQLLNMLAPITPLLVEEALEHAPQWFKSRFEHPATAITDFRSVLKINEDDLNTVKQHLPWIMLAKSACTTAQDEARKSKLVGSSLQASAVLLLPNEAMPMFKHFQKDLATICLVSHLEIKTLDSLSQEPESSAWRIKQSFETPAGEAIAWLLPAKDEKCPRCWRYVAPVEDELCSRCEDVVAAQE